MGYDTLTSTRSPIDPTITSALDKPMEQEAGAKRPWWPVVRWSAPMLNHIVMAGDVCLIVVAAWLAGVIQATDLHLAALGDEALAVAIAAFVGHKVLVRLNAYELQRYRQPIRSMMHILLGVGLGIGIGEAVASMLVVVGPMAWAWALTWAAVAVPLLWLARQVTRTVAEQGLRSGSLCRKVAFIGATDLAQSLIERMSGSDLSQPYRVIGVFDDRALGRRPAEVSNFQVRGTVDALCTYAETNPVDLIVIALPWNRAMQIWAMMQRLQWISADVFIPLEDGGFNPRIARVAAVAGQPALQVTRQPLQGARALIKMAEDYVVASVALVLTAPILAAAAIAVRLTSPGPIIFRQVRIGANRRPFNVLKFRTMFVDASDKGIVGVDRHNPRITRVGSVLRRLSIDELPQLLNVLRGEMSIVGPRPHVPGMMVGTQEYTNAVQEYAARHRIKPGITGWAQVNGMRGGIHSLDKARRGVDLDMHYIDNWSVWFDLRILVRTLVTGIAGRNVF